MAESEIEQIKYSLHEIATHAYSLAMGLQNAAPSVGADVPPPKAVQYLLEVSALLQKVDHDIDDWKNTTFSTQASYGSVQSQAATQKLIDVVEETIKKDHELRELYHTVEKFRFVRDRLALYLERIKSAFATTTSQKKTGLRPMLSDEAQVYVHLYNVHGLRLSTWQNFMSPQLFYEYSVNRPIYAEKAQIESMLRAKVNPSQHGYLTVIVKKSDILQQATEPKDSVGNPLIKVREGSLRQENLVLFTHVDHHYLLNDRGELVPAPDE